MKRLNKYIFYFLYVFSYIGFLALYAISILLLVAVYTWLKSFYDRYHAFMLYNTKDDPWDGYFWNSFVYAIWFVVVSSMLYISQHWYDHQQQVKNIRISQLQTKLRFCGRR